MSVKTPPTSGPRGLLRLVLLILVALVAGGFTIADDDPGKPPPAPSKTTPTPAPAVKVDADRSSDDEPSGSSIGAHEDLSDERPNGVSSAALDAGLEQRSAPGITAPQPVGGAQNYACPYKPVVNRSDRGGQKASLIVLHYTVSRPGSMLAIWRLFNTPSFSASSTYLMEFSGACLRLMPETGPRSKPWTQGNFNGRAISLEIIAMGTETRAQWLKAPIFSKRILAQWLVDVGRRNGIPRRFVDPAGCSVQAAGYTDHDHLECGNDHHDVSPNFPFDVLRKQIADLERLTVTKAAERGDVCNKLRHHRTVFAGLKPGTTEWKARKATIVKLRAKAKSIGLDETKCKGSARATRASAARARKAAVRARGEHRTRPVRVVRSRAARPAPAVRVRPRATSSVSRPAAAPSPALRRR